jgi:hypothetical protein
VQHFYFNNDPANPRVSFMLYERNLSFSLREFCRAIRITYEGDLSKPRLHNSPFEGFYHSLCVGEDKDLMRDKLISIQFPSIHYFVIFISHCLLTKGNPTNNCAPDKYILCSALTGDRSYNLGAIIARRTHENRQSSEIWCGIYATLLLEYMHK